MTSIPYSCLRGQLPNAAKCFERGAVLLLFALVASCGPPGADIDMPVGVAGPDSAIVGEWMPHDVEWSAQPSWVSDPRRTTSTTVLSFERRGALHIAMGRYYLGDSIAFGGDLERRAWLGRWRWLDSTRAELRYRLVFDDMPIRGEPIPGGVAVDTVRAIYGRILDFDYSRGSGGEWKEAFERVRLLRESDRATIRRMSSATQR